jgi:two-component system cell cycle response regulator
MVVSVRGTEMNEIEKRKKILIAEDDSMSRRLLEAILVKWGYDVTVVADGLEALRILDSADAPRLAVLDWMMPGMEGVQICQKLRERKGRPYVYVLLLTARSQKQDLLQGLELGADDYLTKPFDAKELRARLHVGGRILNLQDDLLAAQEALHLRATHDGLTGLPNRAAVLEALDREISRQLRENRPFGIILADIDHFKNVNDTYGHLSGDEVLRTVAKRLRESLRPYDCVGRYGGEEFLIVAPSSDARGTMTLAERIRKQIESQPIVAQTGGTIRVTMSLGIAVSSPSPSVDIKTLLQLADDALYRAKANGRNRSELAVLPGSEDPGSDLVGNCVAKS